MLRPLNACILFTVAIAPAFSQITKIDGVSEPPELTQPPANFKKVTPVDLQLFEIVGHLTNQDEAKTALLSLNKFIDDHPDYSDAYFLRAVGKACFQNEPDLASVGADVEHAMSSPGGTIYNKTDHYSLLGKVALENKQYGQAMDDLEKAMLGDISNPQKMLNIEGTEPQRQSKLCSWNLADFDTLVTKFPKDYRAWLFRGLYYEFFTTFKETYYEPASQDLKNAALVNPRTPVAQFFIGELFTKASFWTKKAWTSDASRDEATKNAISAYSRAIQLDPKYFPAYEARANGYLNLKQYPQAISDYDKALALDPENATAYADRGLAKLETAHFMSASFDFGDAIRRKDENDSSLPQLYEYRGDSDVKMERKLDAVADYSKAIERRLANEIFLLSLKQFRSLYPEYDLVSDEILCRKLNALFYPQMEYKVFAKQLLEENGKWELSLLNDLYEKRGDAYLMSGEYERGVRDFNRIFKAMPNYADSTDRWRALGTNKSGDEYYLDVKSAEFPKSGPVHLWIKKATKKATEVTAYEMDCKARLLMSGSSITYDSNDDAVSSSERSGDWQQIIPDTIGERFYLGACPTIR